MQQAAGCSPLPTLQSCRIRGLHCDPDDLLLLLQSTKPRRIDLQNMTTLSGTWRPIFDFLTSSQANVEDSYLDDLFEARRHVWFDAPGKKKYRHDGTHGCNTVYRQKDAVKRPINYHFSQHRAKGTPSLAKWFERLRSEYGAL